MGANGIRMRENTEEFQVPSKQYEDMPDAYENTTLEDIQAFTVEQLKFWTEVAFASLFRRMLSLEQYRNTEMAELYSQCIVSGPVAYMEDLFRELFKKGVLREANPRQLAVEYYAPLFLLIHMYDIRGDNREAIQILTKHTEHFMENYGVGSGREE